MEQISQHHFAESDAVAVMRSVLSGIKYYPNLYRDPKYCIIVIGWIVSQLPETCKNPGSPNVLFDGWSHGKMTLKY